MPAWHPHPTSGWSWVRLVAYLSRSGGIGATPASPTTAPAHDAVPRSAWPCCGSGPTGRCTTSPRATSTRCTWRSTCCSRSWRRPCSSPGCRRGCGGTSCWRRRSRAPSGSSRVRVVALIVVQRAAAVHPLARGGRRVGALRARALLAPRPAGRVRDRDVVAGDVAAAGAARPVPAGADDVPVRAVARADDPGVVPHVRAAALSRVRDVPGSGGSRRSTISSSPGSR